MGIFVIDGNIGCGKSTLLEYLHTQFRLSIDPEPVQKWQPYLDDMYRRKKGAFEFQVRVWLDRCWIQQRPNMAPIIMERSPYFQNSVFVATNLELGNLTLREFTMIQEMYQRSATLWSPKGYIYLRSDPNKCAERIRQRGRTCEETITDTYLKKLHDFHEHSYMAGVAQGMPIVVIDVEGKGVQQIACEVMQALNLLGINGFAPAPPPPPGFGPS